MTLNETLVELAEEHLARMAALPWYALATSIRRGKGGETFGCEVDGRYFDVGDRAGWAEAPEGDVLLVCHAETPDGERVERQAIVQRA